MSLTQQEKRILALTAELWNALIRLPDRGHSDNSEDERDIHDIQNRLLARVARRTDSELLR
ncbi:hypothetical protein D3C84_1032980 [compost metagenome]